MPSSNPSNNVLCRLRKQWVLATPEEQVRQKWIGTLIDECHFPSSLLAIEKQLQHLPHLAQCQGLPKRRLDLISYGKQIHPTFDPYPLLLIECKAESLTKKAIRQVIGYNYHVGAYFIALVNAQEARLGWFDKEEGEYRFLSHIPSYPKLLEQLGSF